MVYLVTKFLGVYIVDESGKVLEKSYLGKDAVRIAESLRVAQKGKVLQEEKAVLDKMVGVRSDIVVSDMQTARKLSKIYATLDIKVEHPNKGEEVVNQLPEIRENAVLGRQVAIELTKIKLKAEMHEKDKMIVQAIHTVDDFNEAINTIMPRLREWYSLSFPELDSIVEDHEHYLKIVHEFPDKSKIKAEKLEEFGIDENTAKDVAEIAKQSVGTEMTAEEKKLMNNMADRTTELYEQRDQILEYIENTMEEVAPNMKAVIGGALGARLIGLVNGMKRLATLPACTVQLLGAEKALFKFLRSGGRPPKHGVIYQYPELKYAAGWQRGKIARAIAAKVSIASRIDFFKGEFKGDKLKGEMDKKIAEIKERCKDPPKTGRRPVFQKAPEWFKEKHGGGRGGPRRDSYGGGYRREGQRDSRDDRGYQPSRGNFSQSSQKPLDMGNKGYPRRESQRDDRGYPSRDAPREDRGYPRRESPSADGGYQSRSGSIPQSSPRPLDMGNKYPRRESQSADRGYQQVSGQREDRGDRRKPTWVDYKSGRAKGGKPSGKGGAARKRV